MKEKVKAKKKMAPKADKHMDVMQDKKLIKKEVKKGCMKK